MILVHKDELYELRESDPQTDRVLQCLLRSYTGLFADYTYIHEDLLCQRLGMNQQEVYESLLKLNRMHVLHYIPRRRTPYIVYTRERMEPRYVQITREAYEERRERMADRIKSMITYATSSRCRQQMLLEYFGEKADYECGYCDNCIERKNERPPQKILRYKLRKRYSDCSEMGQSAETKSWKASPIQRTRLSRACAFYRTKDSLPPAKTVFTIKINNRRYSGIIKIK